MAEGSDASTANTLCRYYLHGACRQGENCKFSHNRQDRTDTVCRFYLKGQCTYADRCRYDHVRPKGRNSKSKGKSSKSRASPSVLSPSTNKTPPNSRMPAPVRQDPEPVSSNMVSLKKALKQPDTITSPPASAKSPEQWVQATEFVPGQLYRSANRSYADAACSGTDPVPVYEMGTNGTHDPPLCPFAAHRGVCPHGEQCEYVHGDVCEMCGLPVLYPGDEAQNQEHQKQCVASHEADMELSFAIARSQDRQCGICMEVVMEKEPMTERRFGILSDCTHCFCLACIRKWRATKQFEKETIRSCPECRVESDFVTPSDFWVETKEDKLRVIEGYKRALSQISCRYFDQGRGTCNFGSSCFYDHTYPDGTKPSPRKPKPRKRENADGITDYVERMLISDFVQDYEDRAEGIMLLEMLENEIASLTLMNVRVVGYVSSSDDDDSDY